MVQQFLVLGVYARNDEEAEGLPVVYDVIVRGETVRTCKHLGTAIMEAAAQIDGLVGIEVGVPREDMEPAAGHPADEGGSWG